MIPTTPENTMSETKTPLCELCGKRASIVKVGTPGMFACGSCMPADVRTVVEDVRRNKQYGILPGPSGNAVRWLAADRERLLARTTWQPIETAPKDGSCILLVRETRVRCGSWSFPSEQYDNFQDRGGWAWDGSGPPTHWMPLPAPPTEDTNASR